MRSVKHLVPSAAILVAVAVLTATLVSGGEPGSKGFESRRVRAAAEPPLTRAERERLLDAYANLPLTFVENQGQTDSRVRYFAQGPRYAFHLTPEEAVFSFVEGGGAPPARGVALALRFLGGDPRVVEGSERAPGEVNYLQGSDPAGWSTELPRYEQIVYRDLWPGIDLMFGGEAGTLKYEFRVQPGAQVDDIRLAYRGADDVSPDGKGGLSIETALGTLTDSAPVSYQELAGVRVPVESQYALEPSNGGQREYGFAVGAGYQPDRELIIDPGLAYSTLIGGASHESAIGIEVDGAGNTYMTGVTQSPDFPTTSGAFDRSGAASNFLEAFVTKLNPTGTALVYSTFLGGSNFEWGRDIAIDASGNAYVAGQTKSSDFPTTGGAFDRSFNVDSCPRCGIDQYDAFVTKLNAAGSGLVYSTFLGGFDLDDALTIDVDASGTAYVGGETGSTNFPTTAGAFDTSRNGAFDAFVTKLNAAGSALAYSTFLGGSEVDFVGDVTVDAAGNTFAMSSTRSADFPTTAGAFDTTVNGAFDVALTKLNPAGSALVYSTFLGGSDMDGGGEAAIDAAGNAYVAGGTISPDFPTTPGAFDTTLAGSDAFVTKLNATGSALVYSTFVGGSGFESFGGITLDGAGNAWLAGGTDSPDYPTTPGAFDTSLNGTGDATVVQLNAAGSALLDSTFFGGSESDGASDIARDSAGNIYITGQTMSPDFPTTAGAFDRIWNGDPLIFWADAFVAKFGAAASTPPPPAATLSSVSVSPSSVTGGASSQGAVTLSGAAPSGGAPVSLSSSTATVASVPAGVTIPAGATSGSFTISTTSVTASTAVTISASYSGVTRTATLTVGPAGSTPLPAPSLVSPSNNARFSPGQSITFDWTDVGGAASYQLQIDDSSTFGSPFVLNQTGITASRFTTSTLPSRRLWWRVRAVDAAGNPGAWSSVRRIEFRN